MITQPFHFRLRGMQSLLEIVFFFFLGGGGSCCHFVLTFFPLAAKLIGPFPVCQFFRNFVHVALKVDLLLLTLTCYWVNPFDAFYATLIGGHSPYFSKHFLA